MKKYTNRKIYNFTEKHRRKDKSVKRIGWKNAPKSYVRGFNITFRRTSKNITQYNWINNSTLPYYINGRHTAAWMWW